MLDITATATPAAAVSPKTDGTTTRASPGVRAPVPMQARPSRLVPTAAPSSADGALFPSGGAMC
ncbi:hypothetical protein GCM10023405_13250 [Streptomonospora salina]